MEGVDFKPPEYFKKPTQWQAGNFPNKPVQLTLSYLINLHSITKARFF